MANLANILVGFCLGLLQVGPILLGRAFNRIEWPIQLWFIQFQSMGLGSFLAGDLALHSSDMVGNNWGVFYGYLFYPILGLIAEVTGPLAAVFSLAFIFCLAMYFLIFGIARKFGWGPLESMGFSVICQCSIYQMTNLYSRGALPEYFANQSLAISLVLLLSLWVHGFTYVRWTALCLTVLFTAGAHPITAVTGLGVLSISVLLLGAGWGFPRLSKLQIGALLMGMVGVSLALAPWSYAVMKFKATMPISDYNQVEFYFFTDQWWQRWAPLPMEGWWPSSWSPTSGAAGTPYLDANIHVPLFLLGVLGLWRSLPKLKSRTRMAVIVISPFIIAFILGFASSKDHPLNFLVSNLSFLHFAYRMVNPINHFFLLSALLMIGAGFLTRPSRVLVTGLALFSILGGGIKVYKSWNLGTTLSEVSNEQMPQGLYLPSFINQRDFAASRETGLSSFDFKPLGKKNTERVLPSRGNLSSSVITNVMAFDWNHLFLNDRQLGPNELRRNGAVFEVRHNGPLATLTYQWNPDPIWVGLHRASRILIFIFCLAWAGFTVVQIPTSVRF